MTKINMIEAENIIEKWSKLNSNKKDNNGNILTNKDFLLTYGITISDIQQTVVNSEFLQNLIIKDASLNSGNFIALNDTGGNFTDLSSHTIYVALSTETKPSSVNIDGTIRMLALQPKSTNWLNIIWIKDIQEVIPFKLLTLF